MTQSGLTLCRQSRPAQPAQAQVESNLRKFGNWAQYHVIQLRIDVYYLLNDCVVVQRMGFTIESCLSHTYKIVSQSGESALEGTKPSDLDLTCRG